MYTLLIIDPKEDSHINLSDEAKLFSPAVIGPLQNGNIRIWWTSKKHKPLRLVLHLGDLPNSAKWSTLWLVVTALGLELTKLIEEL